MHLLRKEFFILGLFALLLLGVPLSSAFSGADFVDGYKLFVSTYFSFFKHSPLTGQALGGGSDASETPQPCENDIDCPKMLRKIS